MRARRVRTCGTSSARALLRMRTDERMPKLRLVAEPLAVIPSHDFKQPISYPRRVFRARGLHRCFAHPERGRAERRETFGGSAEHPWAVPSARHKTRVNALMTRHARRLRGALRPMTRRTAVGNNVMISILIAASVPIVSQTAIGRLLDAAAQPRACWPRAPRGGNPNAPRPCYRS